MIYEETRSKLFSASVVVDFLKSLCFSHLVSLQPEINMS